MRIKMAVGESWKTPYITTDIDDGVIMLYSEKAGRRLRKLESMLTPKQKNEIYAEMEERRHEWREP